MRCGPPAPPVQPWLGRSGLRACGLPLQGATIPWVVHAASLLLWAFARPAYMRHGPWVSFVCRASRLGAHGMVLLLRWPLPKQYVQYLRYGIGT